MSPRVRAALDPSSAVLILAALAWLALFVTLAVTSLGLVSFLLGLLWAALLIYLIAVIAYAFAREEDSPVKRWTRAALAAPRPAALAVAGAWIVLSLVLAIVNLGGVAFPLGFLWAVMFLYLVAVAIQDYARQQDGSG
ncbi:MAG: hypothetical protein M3N16_01275 [Actinomycetota bacterium]|nr:hypothetical protein [Actinomycetota bacterium]